MTKITNVIVINKNVRAYPGAGSSKRKRAVPR